MSLIVLVYGIILCVTGTFSSLFDPHLFPRKGPFFEGWYMRVTDFDAEDSFGILFGSVLPSSDPNRTDPLVIASFLHRRCEAGSNSCRLTSEDATFALENLTVTVKGEPVTENPDKATPADFKWQVNNGKYGGYFQQVSGKTEFNFKLGNMSISGQASNPYFWNSAGTGPEGWLVNLPLPLHWFVYSLRSDLNSYEIQNLTSGVVISGTRGAVHLEKNWGKSFPEKWIWSEGVSATTDNASFALSGGQVDFLWKMDAYLIGYRKPKNGISLDFRPDNSVVNVDINGCKGYVNLTASSLWNRIEILISAASSTFSSCLLGPETQGFRPVCVESFDAEATVKVYKSSLIPLQYKLIDKESFNMAALEFGGINVCDNKCFKD